jgi:c-di-GMP-binding flagellar brake protein YcgR
MKAERTAYPNTGKRISIELGTPLEIKTEEMEHTLAAVLIGMDTDNYLIIKAPPEGLSAMGDRLSEGKTMAVRYVYIDTVLGFQSRLIKAVPSPIEALFIEYPQTIERYDRRSEERTSSFLETEICIRDKEHRGVIADISQSGCRCLIRTSDGGLPPVYIEEQIRLKWRFPEIEGEQVASGKVRNISRDAHQMMLGVEFDHIAPEARGIIAQYISTRSVEHFWDLWTGPDQEEDPGIIKVRG